ncbi:MAG: hypothetical protein WCO23_00860 [bacterium]
MKNNTSKTQIIGVSIGVIILIGIVALFIFFRKPSTPEFKQAIFFYSDTCPHCKNVEKFIDENNIKAKIDFVSKEVSTNDKNANDLISKGQECKIAEENIGAVPLYWDNGVCTVGDTPIIDYLKSKTQ